MFKFAEIAVLFLVGVTWASAQVCPPPAELTPCTCDEAKLLISCRDIPGRFDIKAVFDRATPFINQSIVFEELEIWDTSLFEIPAHAIPALKFRNIQIDSNRGLDYISPLAFNATYEITEDLSLWHNALLNAAPYERDIFEFFNKFTKVSRIWLPSSGISSIPSHAFTFNPNLKQLYFGSNAITTIGDYAFASLPNLEKLWMSHNLLSYEGLSPNSFQFIGESVEVNFSYNTQIDYLDEAIFKPLLDNAAQIEIGGSSCGPNGCTYRYLTCDARADWICPNIDKYRNKLFGFRCIGGSPANVWEYCENLGRHHAKKLI
jgi:hypothetical protein